MCKEVVVNDHIWRSKSGEATFVPNHAKGWLVTMSKIKGFMVLDPIEKMKLMIKECKITSRRK